MQNIPENMKAVVAYAPGDYRYETVPVPHAGKGEVVIQVEACGICAGDLKAFHGGERFWGGNGTPGYIVPPMIPGHEFIGHVVEIGEGFHGISGLSIGDRVISEQIVPCGKCRFCKNGQYWMCQIHDVYGFKSYLNGGFAEYMKFPEGALIHRVPEEIPLEAAILIEPYACSMHAVERADIQQGDIVVISGAGPLGLGMVAAARLKKPGKLIVLDLYEVRLAQAMKLGCDMVLNPTKVDVQAVVAELTEGYGCDIYIEATGHPASVPQGLQMVRKLGKFIEFSVFNDKVTCDWGVIGDGKELDILGVSLSPFCYPPVIQGIQDGLLKTEGVVTHQYPLSRFMEAFETCSKGVDSLKVVLIPGET